MPPVTVIRAGTKVSFTNRDPHDHHLKSTGATEFEYKTHTKGTPEPLVFNKLGNTIVFCHLHDWMKAYIYVVDTPYFAKSEQAGIALIESLPEGRYRVASWHPDAHAAVLAGREHHCQRHDGGQAELRPRAQAPRPHQAAAGTKAPASTH